MKIDTSGQAPLPQAVIWVARMFLLAGVIGVGVSTYALIQSSRAIDWPSVEGKIIKSELQTISASGPGPRSDRLLLNIRYEYRIDGRLYLGSRVNFGSNTGFRWALRNQLAKYRSGSTHLVHYDPADPATATLETGPSWFLLLMALIASVSAVGGFYSLRWARAHHGNPDSQT